jgi:hypothetical protein
VERRDPENQKDLDARFRGHDGHKLRLGDLRGGMFEEKKDL